MSYFCVSGGGKWWEFGRANEPFFSQKSFRDPFKSNSHHEENEFRVMVVKSCNDQSFCVPDSITTSTFLSMFMG